MGTDSQSLLARHTDAEARALRLLEVTAALSRSVSVSDVVNVVVDKGFSLLGARAGAVGLLTEDGGHVDVLTLSGRPQDMQEEWLGVHPLSLDMPLCKVAKGGQAEFFGTRAQLRSAYGVASDELEPEAKALSCLPLVVGGELIGAITVIYGREQPFTQSDRDFLQTIAGFCAQALDRARLMVRQQLIATTLQQSLLPVASDTAALRVAARYVPGAQGMQVGGDFFDVSALDDGRVAVAIGDVMGRGMRAAALMGQVSAALKAYVLLGLSPSEVLRGLDRVVERIADGAFVTCLIGVYDPAARTLTFANAGHLVPILVREPEPELVVVPPGPPLGLGLSSAYEPVVLPLQQGDLVALYTDGMVENHRQEVTSGQRVLARILGAVSGEDLHVKADRVLKRVVGEALSDDVALLLLQPVMH